MKVCTSHVWPLFGERVTAASFIPSVAVVTCFIRLISKSEFLDYRGNELCVSVSNMGLVEGGKGLQQAALHKEC